MSLQIVQNQQLKPIGDKVPIDTTLSSSSENAISNKAVNDEITRINRDLSAKFKSGLSTTINLSLYNEQSPFVMPEDGYIKVYNVNNTGYAYAMGSSSNRPLVGVGGANGMFSAQVRKGMRVYSYGTSNTVEAFWFAN